MIKMQYWFNKIFVRLFQKKIYIKKNQVALEKLSLYSSMPQEKILKKEQSSIQGLKKSTIAQHNNNQIISTTQTSWVDILIKSVFNPFNFLLFCLIIASSLTDEETGPVIMSIMMIMSIVINFIQSYVSSKESHKLRSLIHTKVNVRRFDDIETNISQEIEVAIEEVRQGEIVLLAAGDIVPADLIILKSRNLCINQSSITGESFPVEKNSELNGSDSVFDRANVCFMGTSVVSGTAEAIVINVGGDTYLSDISKSMTSNLQTNNFETDMKRITMLLIMLIVIVGISVFLINGIMKGRWVEAMMFAIAVAVGMTPEMLPMIITSSLAKGALFLSKQKVIVKNLSSIYSLGTMNVLCTDKTGTITQDHIILHHHIDIHGQNQEDVLRYAYLNSVHQTGLRNLLDTAIIEEAKEKNVDITDFNKIDEIPFDFDRKCMSVILESSASKDKLLICKGAIEELLRNSMHYYDNGKIYKLTPKVMKNILNIVEQRNSEGFRVLGIGYKNIQATQTKYDEEKLIFYGILTFLDPPKDSAAEAIQELINLGVEIKVLTGDNLGTAMKVCKEVGLDINKCISGPELDQLTDQEIKEKIPGVSIFAKLNPLQKSKIIQILRQNNVVGFLGDGINDAPALREADVGISVDTATDIAKECADMILLEKSLEVLVAGVLRSRSVIINIMKYIKMALSGNFGNIISIVGSSFLLPFLPMLPVQLLIQNLLYDISQLVVSFDNVDQEMIKKPYTWSNQQLKRFIWILGPISSIFDYVCFAILWFVFGVQTLNQQGIFQVCWFITGFLTQLSIFHIIRTEKIPIIQSRCSLATGMMAIFTATIALLIPYSYFAKFLLFGPIPPTYFIYMFFIILGYITLSSLIKNWYIKKFKDWI